MLPDPGLKLVPGRADKAGPQPSCLQTTWASSMDQLSSHTVPQVLAQYTSTRPSHLLVPFTSSRSRPWWVIQDIPMRVHSKGLPEIAAIFWESCIVSQGRQTHFTFISFQINSILVLGTTSCVFKTVFDKEIIISWPAGPGTCLAGFLLQVVSLSFWYSFIFIFKNFFIKSYVN